MYNPGRKGVTGSDRRAWRQNIELKWFRGKHDYLLDEGSGESYPFSHEPLMEWGQPTATVGEVTVGIGALAENGAVVIVATDMRASFPRLPAHDECGKHWILPTPFTCGVAVAGLLTIAQPFVDQLWMNFLRLGKQETIYPEHVENEIDDARFRIYKRRIDWEMKSSYGLSLSQWQRGRLPAGKLDPLTLAAGELQSATQNLDWKR